MIQKSQVQRILFHLEILTCASGVNVKEISSAGTERDISEGTQSDYPILTRPERVENGRPNGKKRDVE